ncbi:beta-cyclase [Calothrix sp. HK-06]|nr:beta-cyclase [Calothrix sp. HK-06]
MSYFTFHLIFIIPPILVLAWLQRRPFADIGGYRAKLALPLIALMALIYTTPWDNYLVFREIWGYGIGRVVGTIGYVPIEEYLFFLLQPILTGLWLSFLLYRKSEPVQKESLSSLKVLLPIFGAALTITGFLMLQWDNTLYLGLILAWATPILALQWLLGTSTLWAMKRIWLLGVLVPTLYLWVADRIAIVNGIWHISDKYTTGFQLFGLPIEEATFFLVTNLLVVQGLLLFLLLQIPHVATQENGLSRAQVGESKTIEA